MDNYHTPTNQILVNNTTWNTLLKDSERKNQIIDNYHIQIENFKKDLAANSAVVRTLIDDKIKLQSDIQNLKDQNASLKLELEGVKLSKEEESRDKSPFYDDPSLLINHASEKPIHPSDLIEPLDLSDSNSGMQEALPSETEDTSSNIPTIKKLTEEVKDKSNGIAKMNSDIINLQEMINKSDSTVVHATKQYIKSEKEIQKIQSEITQLKITEKSGDSSSPLKTYDSYKAITENNQQEIDESKLTDEELEEKYSKFIYDDKFLEMTKNICECETTAEIVNKSKAADSNSLQDAKDVINSIRTCRLILKYGKHVDQVKSKQAEDNPLLTSKDRTKLPSPELKPFKFPPPPPPRKKTHNNFIPFSISHDLCRIYRHICRDFQKALKSEDKSAINNAFIFCTIVNNLDMDSDYGDDFDFNTKKKLVSKYQVVYTNYFTKINQLQQRKPIKAIDLAKFIPSSAFLRFLLKYYYDFMVEIASLRFHNHPALVDLFSKCFHSVFMGRKSKVTEIEEWIQGRDIKRKYRDAPSNILTQFAEWHLKQCQKSDLEDIYQEMEEYEEGNNSHLENYKELYFMILSQQNIYRKLERKNSDLLHTFIKSMRKQMWKNSEGNQNKVELNSISDLIKLDVTQQYNFDVEKIKNIIPALKKLDKFIGMKKIKEQILDFIMLSIQGGNHSDNMYHTMIVGPPGVGKSSVAEIIGEIYYHLGLIKSSKEYKFINAKRTDLIGEYIGHSEARTQKKINEAVGGILFIDEAYSLGDKKGGDSFSKVALDVLNRNLTEKKGEFICIIAGYEKELNEAFFSSNPGLKRRFNSQFNIEKYNASELQQIFIKIAEDNKFTVKVKENALQDFFTQNYDKFKFFGGDMETLFNKARILAYKENFNQGTIENISLLNLEEALLKMDRNSEDTDKPPDGMYL